MTMLIHASDVTCTYLGWPGCILRGREKVSYGDAPQQRDMRTYRHDFPRNEFDFLSCSYESQVIGSRTYLLVIQLHS